jgi:hypothetical protein
MQANARARNADNKNTKTKRHHASQYRKAIDGRKQPIRGLWQRWDRFYARLNADPFQLIEAVRPRQGGECRRGTGAWRNDD